MSVTFVEELSDTQTRLSSGDTVSVTVVWTRRVNGNHDAVDIRQGELPAEKGK